MADDANDLKRTIEKILGAIKAPTGQTLAEAALIANVRIDEGALLFTCRDPGWPEPIRRRIEKEIGSAVDDQLPQFETCSFEWQAAAPGHSNTPAPPQRQAGHGHSHGQPAGGQQSGQELTPPDIKHIIAVGSGKGGVGKSTVAASLAFSLKQRGHAVGLMDADVYGPSIPHIVGLTGEQPTVAEGRYQPPSVQGIKTMSMGFLVAPEQAVVWRGPMLHKAVRDFLYLVNWGSLDYLIVDLPPGTGDIVLSLSQQMPITGGVIVCTPQDVALLDARKALNMFRTVKIPCRGVVENMSFFECPKCNERTEIFGNGGAQRWAKEENIPFLGSIPINLQIRLNGDGGKTGDNVEAKSPVKNCFSEIADRLIAGIEADGNPTMPVIEIVD